MASNCAQKSEVKHEAYNGARLSGCLNDVIRQNKYLSLERKARIYKSVVRPVLTYPAETGAAISRTEHILETREVNTLRHSKTSQKMERLVTCGNRLTA
jgi:hypothetical protein